MCFLSHAETLKVFERALVRAGINVCYSQGYNPRPRLSLPLPRSVGVEADDDLLCFGVEGSPVDADDLKGRLCQELPVGFELCSVDVRCDRPAFQPAGATYVLEVRPECLTDELRATAGRLPHQQSLYVQRRIKGGERTRRIDVGPFVESVEISGNHLLVRCRITDRGSIRIGEVLELLGLDASHLASPVRRKAVQWQEKHRQRTNVITEPR